MVKDLGSADETEHNRHSVLHSFRLAAVRLVTLMSTVAHQKSAKDLITWTLLIADNVRSYRTRVPGFGALHRLLTADLLQLAPGTA
jgi:hypothetical protein